MEISSILKCTPLLTFAHLQIQEPSHRFYWPGSTHEAGMVSVCASKLRPQSLGRKPQKENERWPHSPSRWLLNLCFSKEWEKVLEIL
jgi:hypothetical protein